ncbi:MAG: flagellar FliJ family protein [Azospirillaceae bacterium]|nr:flagellar FliJ family protein [Azospirillaceae bacterium]
MKSLKTLIRLHKNEVDEKRRRLTQLREREEELTERRRQFEEQVEVERKLSGTSLDLSFTIAAYLKQAKIQRNALEQAKHQLHALIVEAEEELATAFQELKRFELAEEERIRQEKAEFARKEALMLDEIAAQRHTRQHEGDFGEE